MRRRYGPIFGTKFLPDKMCIRSADVDIAIRSAQAFAAGMFPGEIGSNWSNELLWQPTPIHTIPCKLDRPIFNAKYNQRYTEALDDFLLNSKEYKKVLTDNTPIFQYLTQYSGQFVISPEDAYILYDTLRIEKKLFKK